MAGTGDFKVAVKLHADASQYTAEFTKASQLAQSFADTLQSGGSQAASGLQTATTASQALGAATVSSSQQASSGLNQVSTAAQSLGSQLQATGTQATQASQGMDGLTRSSREATQSQQQSRAAGDALIAMLRDQIATTGKSADELLRYRAAQSGVAAEAAPLILQWQNQKAAQLAAAEAARQEEAAQREAQAAKQRATQAQEQFLAGLREQVALQGKSSTEVLQYRAAQLGVSAEAANSIRLIDEANQKGAISAGQHAQAMRMLPAQMTDVVTSVASGMPIWMVAIQQGGQIKDSFGGAGNAARAMLGAITPLTAGLAAGTAVIGLTAAAYYQGSAEADRYREAIVTTGNASGVTVDQLSQYAKEIDGVAGTQARAAEGLAAFTAAGVEGGAQLRQYTQTAIEWENATGQAVTKTAEQFASLQKDPLNATLKLNEGMNFLTASTFEQIKALTDQGQSAEASRVAMDALDAAMRDRSKTIKDNLGSLERGWNSIKGAAAEAWDAMLNIGRSSSIGDQIAKAQEALDKKLAEGPGLFDRAQHNQTVERLRAEIWALQEKSNAELAGAVAQEHQNKATQAAIAGSQLREKHLSKEEKKTRDLTKAQAVYNEVLAYIDPGDTQKRLAAEKDHLAIVASINEQYKERKAKGSGGISVTDTELANMRSQLTAAKQYHDQLLTLGPAASTLNAGERESLKIAEQLKVATDAKTVARLKEKQVVADALGVQLRTNEGLEKGYKAEQQQHEAMVRGTESITQRAKDQEAANAVFGKGRTAIEEMTLAELEHQLAAAKSGKASAQRIADLEDQVTAQKRWVNALGQADYKAVNAHADELLRNAQELSKTYEDELALSGLTALEREKIVAQRSVELKYAKELAKLDQQSLKDDEKAAARQKIEQARDIESAAVVAKAHESHMAKASEEINRSLTDALMRGFEDGKGMAENLADTTVNLFKTMVLRPTISAVMTPVSVAINGVVQQGLNAVGLGSGTSPLAQAQTASSAYNLVSGGMNVAATAGKSLASSELLAQYGSDAVREMAGQFGAGMMNTASWSGFSQAFSAGGAQMAGAIAGSVLNGFSGYGISSMLSGGYSAGSWVNTAAGIASAIPGIGPIAGVVGGVVNRLFGRKLKDQGIEGQFGGEDGFTGNTYQYYKGGLLRSSKTKRGTLDEDLRQSMEDQFNAMRLGTVAMADSLSLGTSAVNSFTAGIKVSFKGLDEAGIQKALAEEFDKIAESMAQATLGTTEYTRTGETSVEAITRLSGSLVTVNGVLGNLNSTLYTASLAGADMASSLVDLFGGASSFSAATGSYFQNFYSAQEQRDAAQRALQKQLDAVQLTLPEIDASNAREQYRLLTEAQDLNTEAGRRAWAVLVQGSDAFAGLTQSAEDVAAQTASIARKEQDLQIQLLRAQGNALAATNLERQRELEALAEYGKTSQALQQQIWALQDQALERSERSLRLQRQQEARAAADEIVSAQREAFQRLGKSLADEALRAGGGMIGSLAVSAQEAESAQQFAEVLDGATASLAELEKLGLADELSGYTAEIGKLIQSTKEMLADQVAASRLLAGNAQGAVAALMSASELNYAQFTSGGNFSAGAFNAALAKERAGMAAGLIADASVNALQIQNVGTVIGQLMGVVSEAREYVARDTLQDVAHAVAAAASSSVVHALSSVVDVLTTQALERFAPSAPGLAHIGKAQRAYAAASQVDYIDGKMVMGAEAIAYARSIRELDAGLRAGAVTADEYAAAMRLLEARLGEAGNVLGALSSQMAGAASAALDVSRAGFEGLDHYFASITANAQALDAKARETATPLGQVSDGIGRMQSAATAFGASADAVLTGLQGAVGHYAAAAEQAIVDARGVVAGSEAWYGLYDASARYAAQSAAAQHELAGQMNTEGSQLRKGTLAADAARIAAEVMTTASAAEFAKQIKQSQAFSAADATGIRDASLLLDGVRANDASAFEGAYARMTAALDKGTLTEAQYVELMNLGLRTLSGEQAELEKRSSELANAFTRLRDAAKSTADALLLSETDSTLTGEQRLSEAQRQYAEILAKARAGDADAASGLDSASKTLLDAARSISSEIEYRSLFAETIRDLRVLEGATAPIVKAGDVAASTTTPVLKVPAFDVGTNYLPSDMLALVHAGERIIPAADNRQLMQALQGSGSTEVVSLLREIVVRLQELETSNLNGHHAVQLATAKGTEALQQIVVEGIRPYEASQ